MKRFVKGMMTSASILLGLGLILAVSGWALGGKTSMTVDVAGYQVNVGFGGFSATQDMTNAKQATGQALEPFETLDIDIDLGDISVVPSDHFGIDLWWKGDNYEVHHENKNGTLKIWSSTRVQLGINVPGGQDCSVTVYVPESTTLERVEIKASLGDVDLTGLKTKSLEVRASLGSVDMTDAEVAEGVLKLDLGDLHMEQISAEALDITLSLGDISAYGMTTAKELTVVNHMGKVEIVGTLRGKTDVTDNMGDVYLQSALPEQDYGYNLDTSMGSVYVNGDDKGDKASSSGKENTITVNNSMGDITLDFQ